jgi:integral membrane protein
VKYPSTSAIVRVFRLLAVAEAFSWAALMTGMYLKWIARTTELGVEIAGPVHGALFIGYGIAALALWRLQRWPFPVALFAGLSAVFPFATVLFERWADRRGHLSAVPAADVAAVGTRGETPAQEPAVEETAAR